MMAIDFYNQGKLKAQQGDYQSAITDFSQALQLNSYFVEAYYERGLAYFDLGQIYQAISDYTHIIEIDSEYAQAYYARALAKLSLKNFPASLADIDKAISLNPKYAPAYQLKGIIKRKIGEIQSAIVCFKQAANLYLEEKDAASCRNCLDLIKQVEIPANIPISNFSNKPSPSPLPILKTEDFYHQILNKAEHGQFQKALDELNYLLQLDTQDAMAYRCRGVILRKMGDYQKALADFNQALRLNPQDEIALRNRGKTRSQLGDLGGAIADFNQALQLNPQDVLLLIARGEAYSGVGNFQGAIADFTQALQINPNQASAYISRASVYMKLEDLQNAILDYQKAVSIFLEKEDWQNYQKTLDFLKQIQTRNPNSYNTQLPTNPLRQRLMMLVGGYWEIAERLINQAKQHYHGMPEDWYIQKVIHDIERDKS